MDIITTQAALDEFCSHAAKAPFICIDTEFMREKTFYSKLCLIQIATSEAAAIIDPLAEGLDLAPFNDLLLNTSITKVLHAARQDMEIFYQLCSAVPTPIFDTQIAAMALGYGESVGYSALVKGRLGRNLDKGARFTDWSRRPLTPKQLKYALGDVTHLCDLYPPLIQDLDNLGRTKWLREEMNKQHDESLYQFASDKAWKRLKIRSYKKPYLAVLKAVATWREDEAKSRDIPRRRVLKDDAVYDLAQQRPTHKEALAKLRSMPGGFEKSRFAKSLLDAVNQALEDPEANAPHIIRAKAMPANLGPTMEMLKTLLRLRTEYVDIAPRLVASASDIEQLAAYGKDAQIPALEGWRYNIFGRDALDMMAGKIALRLQDREVIAEPTNG